MAEGLFLKAMETRRDYRARSAGVGAIDGQSPSKNAVIALQEVGLDISGQRSNMLSHDLVREADYIFGMTNGHVDAIRMLFPWAAEKVFLLREFDDTLQEYEKDISDPIGGSLDVYRHCRDEIAQGIQTMLTTIDHLNRQNRTGSSQEVEVFFGSDHAGYELKKVLKDHLADKKLPISDAGTNSAESTDYPDYARIVSEEVSSGRSKFGILVCSSGIGMSIAANKIHGVRAALVFNEEMAVLSRRHNDANILCLGQNFVSAEDAIKIVDAFLSAEFEGGRHERRVGKLGIGGVALSGWVARVDPEIARDIELERLRQQENIELIASENFTSPAVMEAQGSVLTNKYAEGYPGKRWYGGCENVDQVEELAIARAKELFGVEHANVQAHSGSGANMAVYFSVLQPGDKILTMDLSHGGHLTHGNKANFSGRFFDITHYGVSQEEERIDYDQLARMAEQDKPRMITVGASAYPRIIDFKRMGEIARSVNAYLLADIAHIAGLVAAGLHPSPVGHADFVTTTTHKTLRGPRGGLVMCREEFAKKIDSQVFPGIQGGPLMHVIAAKAVCLKEALQPDFKTYQQNVINNAAALAEGMKRNGFRLVSGGTDNHLMLVDVQSRGLTGKDCQLALDEAGITVNKNTIPFETLSPFKASGIRLGSPAVTTRGMGTAEMAGIADMISEVLMDLEDHEAAKQVRKRVRELTAKFPLPY